MNLALYQLATAQPAIASVEPAAELRTLQKTLVWFLTPILPVIPAPGVLTAPVCVHTYPHIDMLYTYLKII